MKILVKNIIYVCAVLAVIQYLHVENFYAQTKDVEIIKVKKISDTNGNRVRVSGKKKIYIMHPVNHDITALDSTFKVIEKIGGFGQGPGELYTPFDFDVDKKERVWVIDHFNGRIQVFSKTGDYIKEIPKSNKIISITCIPDNRVYINNTKDNSNFSKLNINNDKSKLYGSYREISWLGPIINEITKNTNERQSLYKKNIEFFNIAWIRSDGSGDLYLCFLYAPIIRKYSLTGDLLLDVEIKAPGIDSLMFEARRSLKGNMATGQPVGYVVIQDFFVSPQDGFIYILPANSQLDILVYDDMGNFIKEIRLIDEETDQIYIPAGICYYKKYQWIVTNHQGTFLFTDKH